MEIKNKIKSIDKSNMYQVILDFPKQFRIGAKAAENVHLKFGTLLKEPENIIVCGMGGSALAGEILATLRPLDIVPYKDYGLPPQAGNESLIICVSYSGKTEETISAFEEAKKRRLPLVAISTNGKLIKLAKKYSIPYAKLPKPLLPPRLAIGEMFAALVQILANHNLAGDLLKKTLKLEKNLNVKKFKNQGKKLAKRIFKKIPIVYTTRRYRSVGLIWKFSLNETAKILAMTNYFPELNHSEIVGFWKINEMQLENKKLHVIILRDSQSHPRNLIQMKITKSLLEREGIKVEFVEMKGKNMVEKIFSTILLGFWTAYWLALEYKVDPTPAKLIKEFKRRLRSVKKGSIKN